MRRGGSKVIPLAAALSGSLAMVLLAVFVAFVLTGGPASSLSRLAVRSAALPITVTVFGRGADTVSARIVFHDPSGEIVGIVERSWSGWELKIDSILVASRGGWLVFPFRAYTDETTANRGVDLIKRYERNGIPGYYNAPFITERERTALSRLFFLVKTERWVPRILGSLHRNTLSVRSFEPGVEYSLFVTADGRLILAAN